MDLDVATWRDAAERDVGRKTKRGRRSRGAEAEGSEPELMGKEGSSHEEGGRIMPTRGLAVDATTPPPDEAVPTEGGGRSC